MSKLLRCGEIFRDKFIKNLLLSVSVNNFENRSISDVVMTKNGSLFFVPHCIYYIHVSVSQYIIVMPIDMNIIQVT